MRFVENDQLCSGDALEDPRQRRRRDGGQGGGAEERAAVHPLRLNSPGEKRKFGGVKLESPVPVFWCEPIGKLRRQFRTYGKKVDGCSAFYCEALRPLDDVEEERVVLPDGDWHWKSYEVKDFPWDAFPTNCDTCRREIQEPSRQIHWDRLFVIKTGPRAGEIFSSDKVPVGAMWDDETLGLWRGKQDIGYTGPDGITLTVQLPCGPWHVDAQASNCTLPQYVPVEGEPNTRRFVRSHYCWCRRGDPRTGYVHVDKDGFTCEAGAGSIWQNMGAKDDFHGFLYRGFIIDCDDKGRVDALLDRAAPNPVAPAERVLKVHQIDRPVRVRPVIPPPVGRPQAAGRRKLMAWRSNRSP